LVDFKIIISNAKTGKSEVKELKDQEAKMFVGTRIGDIIQGDALGLEGKIKITGGSDRAGFPMRSDILGGGKNRVLLSRGIGLQNAEKGEKKRMLIRGNVITDEIYQVNAVLI
jgi:small subunit ribosomal protein S6e|tara:strand:- start:1 stop:339 length:339 start_codon:yes stop_codon:yes gene_type:complete